jgi:SAM-dependent methyltransferase
MKKKLPHMYGKYRTVWGDETAMLNLEREIIESKPILALLWRRWYKELEPFLPENGVNVEVGAGGGFASTYFNNLIQSDVVKTPHINLCCNALSFPFKDRALDSIVMIGVLHHFRNVEDFFNEARRVLKKNGKVLMVEPYVSYLSYPVWELLHYEYCNLKSLSIDSDEYARIDANLAIPTILFRKKRKQFEENHPDLNIIYESYHTIFHHFASGGYTYPSLVPGFLVPALVKIEKLLQPFGKWLGSWMTLVIQVD